MQTQSSIHQNEKYSDKQLSVAHGIELVSIENKINETDRKKAFQNLIEKLAMMPWNG